MAQRFFRFAGELIVLCTILTGASCAAPCPSVLDHLPPSSPACLLDAWSCELRFAAPDDGPEAPGPFSFRPWYGQIDERYTLNWETGQGFHLEVELSQGPTDTLRYRERLEELASFLSGFLDVWNSAMFRVPCETVPDSTSWSAEDGGWCARYPVAPDGFVEQHWDSSGFPRGIQGWQEGIQLFQADLAPLVTHGENLLGQADIWLESGLVHYHFRLEYSLVSRFLMPARLLFNSSVWGSEQELRIEFRQYQWRIKDRDHDDDVGRE